MSVAKTGVVSGHTENLVPESAAPRATGLLALIAATAVAPTAWGTTYWVTTEMLPPERPMFAALMRSLPLGLTVVILTRALLTKDWWWKAAVLGTFNIGAFFPLLFIAAERLPGGVAATLGATQPLFVAGLGATVLGERVSALRLTSGVLGLIGVGLIVLGPGASFDSLGILAGMTGACAMGVGITLTKLWGRPIGIGPFAFAAWQLTVGGLVLLPGTLLFEGVPSHVGAAGAFGYVWLGTVGGVVAYALWFRGIGRLPVGAAAILSLMSPLVAALIGVLCGERLNLIQFTGFILALVALVAGSAELRAFHVVLIPNKLASVLSLRDNADELKTTRFQP